MEEFYRATPVVAPIGGTVIQRKVEPGQSFTGADALLVIADLLLVEAQVDETDIAQIRLRQQAHIALDAYPDGPFAGRVDQIAYDAKTVNNVTTYEVDILPEKTPPFMRSGMTANVSFVAATRQNVLRLPSDAVKSRDGHLYVLLPAAKPNGAPVEREVKLGLSDGKHTEVLEGVTEGEKLLVLLIRTGTRTDSASSPLTPFGRKKK